jgi:hypothetical protein
MNENRRKQRDGMRERVIEGEEDRTTEGCKEKRKNFSKINQFYSFWLLRY